MSIITKRPDNWINTWISKNYCRHWGLHEGLRELYAINMMEYVILLKKKKLNLKKWKMEQIIYFVIPIIKI